jgi:hypothetical protein
MTKRIGDMSELPSTVVSGLPTVVFWTVVTTLLWPFVCGGLALIGLGRVGFYAAKLPWPWVLIIALPVCAVCTFLSSATRRTRT